MICLARSSSGSLTSAAATASSISAWSFTSSLTNSVSSASASPIGPDQAELLLAGEHEAAEGGHLGLLHRLEQEHIRAARRLRGGGDEEVGAVEVDRVDLLEPDEAADLDRA